MFKKKVVKGAKGAGPKVPVAKGSAKVNPFLAMLAAKKKSAKKK